VTIVFTSKTSKSPKNKMFWLQVSPFLSGDSLLLCTIVFTSKTSKSIKSPKNEMFWLQLCLRTLQFSSCTIGLVHDVNGFLEATLQLDLQCQPFCGAQISVHLRGPCSYPQGINAISPLLTVRMLARDTHRCDRFESVRVGVL
jgi:hypothetical protein